MFSQKNARQPRASASGRLKKEIGSPYRETGGKEFSPGKPPLLIDWLFSFSYNKAIQLGAGRDDELSRHASWHTDLFEVSEKRRL